MSEEDREKLRRALRLLARDRLAEERFVAFERRGECLVVFVVNLASKNSVGQDITLLRLLAQAFGARNAMIEIAAAIGRAPLASPRPVQVVDLEGARQLARKISESRGR
jgi:hypothetical protein